VDETISNAVKNRLLSAFPDGTFAWVDVLGYGDDPAVEPGDTAVRVFIARGGGPEENWDSKETLDEWAKANGEGIEKLHNGLLPFIAWVDFVLDTPEHRAKPYDQTFSGTRFMGRPDVLEGVPGGARVGTWLGPADLATVDALIVAGVGTSRAEVLRWAIGRIRENPAYAQLQQQVRETGEQGSVLGEDIEHSGRPTPSLTRCRSSTSQLNSLRAIQQFHTAGRGGATRRRPRPAPGSRVLAAPEPTGSQVVPARHRRARL